MTDVPRNNEQSSGHVDADKIYYPHSNQQLILKDKHRYKIIVAGRRFGKTAMALNIALAWLLNPALKNKMIWIILPEYKQARSVYWLDPDISKYYLPYVDGKALRKNDSDLSLYHERNNNRLILKGSDTPGSLRGAGLDLIIWDETQDIKASAFDIISPTLADSPNHRVIYIGTPNGYNNFHDLSLRGDHKNIIEKAGKLVTPQPQFITYRFTSYDNTTWAEGTRERQMFVNYLDSERRRYEEMGQLDWFEQEYMAQFRKRAGAVHKTFDRTIHVISDFIVPKEWRRIRGFDFGSTDPTSSIRFAIDNDQNWFIEYCYKQGDKSIDYHTEQIKMQDADMGFNVPGYGDPSGAQWITEFNNRGLSIRGAKKKNKQADRSWVQLGIDMINAKIQPKKGHVVMLPDGRMIEDAPSFFILNRPSNQSLIDEIETLAYKKTTSGLSNTDIDDTQDKAGHYDLHAALRYATVSEATGIYYSTVELPLQKPTLMSATQKVQNLSLMPEDERRRLEKEADLAIIRSQNFMR